MMHTNNLIINKLHQFSQYESAATCSGYRMTISEVLIHRTYHMIKPKEILLFEDVWMQILIIVLYYTRKDKSKVLPKTGHEGTEAE